MPHETASAPAAAIAQRQRYLSALEQRFALAFAELGSVSAAALRAGYSESFARTSAYRLMRRDRVQLAILEARAELARQRDMHLGRKMAADVTPSRVIAELAKLAFADPRDLFAADGKLKPIHELDDAGAANIAALDVLVATGRRAPARATATRGTAGRAPAARGKTAIGKTAGGKTGRGKAAEAAERDATGEVAQGSADDGSAVDASAIEASAIDTPEVAAAETADPDLAGQVLEVRKIKCWDKTRALELLGRTLGLFKDRLDAGTAQDLAAGIEAARQRARALRETAQQEKSLRDRAPDLVVQGEGELGKIGGDNSV